MVPKATSAESPPGNPDVRSGQMRVLSAALSAGLLAIGLVAATSADPPASLAITGARLVTVSGSVIEKGNLIVRDSLIESLGADAKVPADAKVIEGAGLTVCPGFIDAGSEVLTPPSPEAAAAPPMGGGRRGAPAAAGPTTPPLSAHVRVWEQPLDFAARLDAVRTAGFTSVLALPGQGVISGQSAVFNLGADRDSSLLRPSVAMHTRLAGGGFRQYPGSLMGKIAFIRQSLLDARWHSESWDLYRSDPKGLSRPTASPALDALRPVVDGVMPLVVPAATAEEVRRAGRLAAEFAIPWIVQGGGEAHEALDVLRGGKTPVLLQVQFPERPREVNPDDPDDLKIVERRVAAPRTAGKLAAGGVPFAFASAGQSAPEFLRSIQRCVTAGLPSDRALQSLTLGAARILGVGAQVGSLEPGKIANLVISQGDPLTAAGRIRHIVIDGKVYEPVVAPETRPMGGGRRPREEGN